MSDEDDNSLEPAARRAVPAPSSAAYAADILALGRAALDALDRAIRSAPEVRRNRVMARWPIDLEDLLFELEPTEAETSLAELASQLGVSSAQLRSTALRLERLSLVRVSTDGIALTAMGRQKLARLTAARMAALRRIATGLEAIETGDGALIVSLLARLIERADEVTDLHVGRKTVSVGRSNADVDGHA